MRNKINIQTTDCPYECLPIKNLNISGRNDKTVLFLQKTYL